MSDYSLSALSILRNPQLTLKWYVVPLLLVVMYIYTKEAHEKNWNVILGGIALWGMDLFNEIWNSIVFHATNFAPVWGTPMGVGETALLLLIGYNIEISFMFAMMGIMACLSLPKDPKQKILGINNRVFLAVVYTTLAVVVECFLNYSGLLTWEYPWWSIKCPYLIWLIGYLPFFTMAFVVHDMKKMKNKILALGIIFGVNIILLVVFGFMGWM
ncbi:MAG TPA: hypothetical protein VN417_07335 [Candidatus Cryosericum sp.]|nr:hypothetical protein [Candidatus Cryosericum sp.]